MRMRTTLLLALLSVSFGLSAMSLFVIRTSLQRQIRLDIRSDLRHSVLTFQNLQAQRREMLSREAALLADLPSLKALMTTADPRTIEDGGAEFWTVSGTDIFALADRRGVVVAVYEKGRRGGASDAAQRLQAVLSEPGGPHLLQTGGRLYEISMEPLYFGSPASGTRLGYVAIGFALDDTVAREVSAPAAADVMFVANGSIAATTLDPAHAEAAARAGLLVRGEVNGEDVWLGREHYLVSSLPLSQPAPPARSPAVRLVVLKSYDEASRFLNRLNRLVAGLGLLVLISGGAIALYLAGTITGPLERLAAAARALGAGDFDFEHKQEGAREIRELGSAFDGMRRQLRGTQLELLEAERLATIGRMASSISHDLRHSLSAVYANAEFLEYPAISAAERAELLAEVREAVGGMTELIDSLLLFSRTGQALQLSLEPVSSLIERALAMVKRHPDAQRVRITTDALPPIEACVDARKIERAIFNLLLNACQAAQGGAETPYVRVSLAETEEWLSITVADNGGGVPESIRATLFEPFVSGGKPNGMGLGLTIAHRIAVEHGGSVSMQESHLHEPDRGETAFALCLAKSRLQAFANGTVKEQASSPVGHL